MALLNQTQQDYYDGNDFGGYQFISLEHIITNFTIAYVGEGKIIPKIRRTDIAFHAQRAIQELSFDTFKSIKSQEITLPPSNTMVLPQDYVNYTKVCWVDGNGIERPLYPTKHTSNPTPILQDSDGEYAITGDAQYQLADGLYILDGLFEDIEIGFTVFSSLLTSPAMVSSVYQNSSTTTAVVLVEQGDPTTFVEPILGVSITGSIPLNFTGIDGSLLLENESTFTLLTVDASINSNEIEQVATSIPIEMKVGMKVIHEAFPNGTVVEHLQMTAINTLTVTVSNLATLNIVSTAANGNVTFAQPGDSTTWGSYSSDTSNSTGDGNGYNHDTDIYDLNIGQRYGVDPAMAQGNGTYYIDNLKGLIHFSSNISGKTVILKYISDGLGDDDEMMVHKFAEEAMYKCIAYAIFSTTITGQQLVPRFKKEKFAAVRQAKLRLSNIKIEELTQLMRGKSKWIKH